MEPMGWIVAGNMGPVVGRIFVELLVNIVF